MHKFARALDLYVIRTTSKDCMGIILTVIVYGKNLMNAYLI